MEPAPRRGLTWHGAGSEARSLSLVSGPEQPPLHEELMAPCFLQPFPPASSQGDPPHSPPHNNPFSRLSLTLFLAGSLHCLHFPNPTCLPALFLSDRGSRFLPPPQLAPLISGEPRGEIGDFVSLFGNITCGSVQKLAKTAEGGEEKNPGVLTVNHSCFNPLDRSPLPDLGLEPRRSPGSQTYFLM